MAGDDDPSTVMSSRPLSGRDPADTHSAVPALTIQWHYDLRRVGQAAPLGPGVTEVSRRTPPFDAATDVVLSRSTFFVVDYRADALEIRPGNTPTAVEVDGTPLVQPRRITHEQLDGGVIVTLADAIVVCLHRLRTPVVRGPTFGIVGGSDAMEGVRRQIGKVADLDVPVLIRGETGTGKEMVARAVFAASGRAGGPFVTTNMATVPPTTAADELFGHDRGAFTGASESRPGLFIEADGGTLFLDEIGDTSANVQPMLLRVLDEGEVRSLGGRRSRRVNVRVLAATDANLEMAVQQGRFAEQLLHRLSGYQIRLPALRERREDIGLLFLHFLRKALATTDELDSLETREAKHRPWLDARDFARIARSPFPGNVRRVRNIANQLVISSRGEPFAKFDDTVEDLLTSSESTTPGHAPGKPMRPGRVTDEDIREALRRHNYNFAATAASLGINRGTLYDRTRGNPGDVRSASSLADDEILDSHDRHRGDIPAMANELRVSPKPLKARVTETLRRRRP
jgi:two-component system nitrogen regulation response regulator GlnG